METLVNNSEETKTTTLRNCGWFEDKLASLSGAYLAKDAHKAAVTERKKLISGSKTLDMMGKLHISLLQQSLYMIPNVSILIKLLRSSPALSLMCVGGEESEYSIKITKADLLIRKVRIHPSIVNTHNTLLSEGKTVKYPYNQVETQVFTISPGRQSQKITVYQNRLEPKRMFICLIDHEAKNGSYSLPSFRLEHYQLSSINLIVNGHTVPVKPIQLNFEKDLYMRAYLDFQMTCGKMFTNHSNGITYKDYANGCTLFAFDLTADLCEGSGVHLLRQSTTDLELSFAKPLPNTVSIFTYSEFDEMLEIDHTRIVTKASVK